MLARHTMTRDVIVAPPELSLDLAYGIMRSRRIRHLPVVAAGKLLGILSDRDVLLRATLGDDGAPIVPQSPVGAAMTPAPFVCLSDTSVADIVRLLTEHKIDAAPIVSEAGGLVGLVTTTDLMLLLIDFDPARPLPFDFNVRSADAAAMA